MAIARVKTWVSETLTHTDLNAEFDNIINNLTLANIGDYSGNATEMRTTVDPYPAGAESLATDATGEIARLRYVIAQITGRTYWYQDPTTTLTAMPSLLGLTATVNANSLTVTLTDSSGTAVSSTTNVVIPFRSATLGSGAQVNRTVSAATAITLTAGATLGFAADQVSKIYVWAIDNAGTVELALSGSPMFMEDVLHSTTAEGGDGSADTAYTLYSTTARTAVAVRCIGYLVIQTGSTAGNWSAAPTTIQVIGTGIDSPSSIPGSLIYDSGRLPAKATTLTILGLNGEAHGGYDVELCLVAGETCRFRMYYENDTTNSNYSYHSESWVDDAYISTGNLSSGNTLICTGDITLTPNLFISSCVNVRSASSAEQAGYTIIHNKDAAVANLTRIDLTANVANGIGIGSRVRLWRKA